MGFVFCYITTSSEKEAFTLARHLLGKKMIGCANVFPVTSFYSWNRKIKTGKEWVLLAKTERKYASVVQREVEQKHSYETPCVTIIPVSPNVRYATWLSAQLGTKKVSAKGRG